jgi:hypothetical protein
MYQQLREEQVKEGNKCVTCGNGGPGATFPENKCIKCLLLKYKTMEKFVKLLSTPVSHLFYLFIKYKTMGYFNILFIYFMFSLSFHSLYLTRWFFFVTITRWFITIRLRSVLTGNSIKYVNMRIGVSLPTGMLTLENLVLFRPCARHMVLLYHMSEW